MRQAKFREDFLTFSPAVSGAQPDRLGVKVVTLRQAARAISDDSWSIAVGTVSEISSVLLAGDRFTRYPPESTFAVISSPSVGEDDISSWKSAMPALARSWFFLAPTLDPDLSSKLDELITAFSETHGHQALSSVHFRQERQQFAHENQMEEESGWWALQHKGDPSGNPRTDSTQPPRPTLLEVLTILNEFDDEQLRAVQQFLAATLKKREQE